MLPRSGLFFGVATTHHQTTIAMTHPTRVPTVLLLVVVLSMAKAHAQPADPDSFQVWMQAAWKEVGQADFPDSLQRAYGWEFFHYYRQHPHTETGAEAGWQAFLLWKNAGAVTEMDEALSQLSDESELWSSILHYVSSAYAGSEHRDTEDLYVLLKDLENRLTHPASRSAALLELARYYQGQNKKEEAQELFREIVKLDAPAFFVDQALGALHEMESLNLGQKAPHFTAETVKGDVLALDDFRGAYVLIEFWATWCGPCMPEIPHLKALWSHYHDRGLQIIGVTLDADGQTVERFIEEHEMEWPQVMQRRSWKGEVVRLYNVAGIPTTYLIGPEGTIVSKNLRGEDLEREIPRLMEASETR